ncbi:GNAT family N-acetyltransferase [Chitinophaga lutea]
MDTSFLELTPGDLPLLEQFLEQSPKAQETFRYFSSRPTSIIQHHLLTVLLLDGEKAPIGYGHLDQEGETTWLGVAVSDQAQARGHGGKIIQYLIDWALNSKIAEIHLSVDKVNVRAIGLYERFGFERERDLNERSIIMKRKPN